MVTEWHKRKLTGEKPRVWLKTFKVTPEVIEAVKKELLDGWSFQIALRRGAGINSAHSKKNEIRNHPEIAPLCRDRK